MADSTCPGGTVACWIASQVDILTNLAKTLQPVEQMLTGAAYILGLGFAFKALYALKAYGEARTAMSNNASMKEPLTYFLVAAVFIYFPTAFKLLLNSTFGYTSVLQYAPINSGSSALDTLFGSGSAVGRPLTMLIQVIGIIAFIRGWILIARAASHGAQPGGTGKGFMHVFGGILAINIVGTLEIVNNTLYGS